jgi:aryl-alcohol dehydrogenase-like predicted oxidoreductase
MECRHLGRSGFKVPVLSFGTFGGKGPLFSAWGHTDVAQARRLVDVCLEAAVTMFDSADVDSAGSAESILGEVNQLRQNLGAVGWSLNAEQMAHLDAASATTPAYPYWHQRGFVERNPLPVADGA